MARRMKVMVMFPPIVDVDIDFRELTVQVEGEEGKSIQKIDPLAPSSQFAIPIGTKIKVTLVDVDKAGNRSLPREQFFVANDTIAPQQPGELKIDVVGEMPEEE